MEEILKERDVSFPSVGKPNFHCLASSMVGDALTVNISKLLPMFKCFFTKFIFFQDLKSNWTRQSFGSFHFSLNDCPKKPSPKENGLFTIHKQLIVRTNREGCIVTRSRFKSDDDEHVSISFVT